MKSFIASLLILASVTLSAQTFPQQFVGHWQGELQWFRAGNAVPSVVKMQLIVRPADSAGHYNWQIIYGENNSDNRPYLLKPVDTAKGHWMIDERNGILLDQYWIAGRLTNAFTVQTTSIVNSYWLEGDTLVAEFYSFTAKAVTNSGGSSRDIPPVSSFGAKGYQVARLKKIGGS